MGEGGCDPDYFLHRMGFSEARRYLRGLNRRHRNGWEQTKIIGTVIAGCLGNEFELDLPWQREKKAPVSQEELDAARQRARELEKILNKK